VTSALATAGTRFDPVWTGSARAATLVMASAWPGAAGGRVARIARALEEVLPKAGQRFLEALGPDARPTSARAHRAATVGLANALLDHYLTLGLRVWEARGDPRVVRPLERAGLAGTGLGDAKLDEAGKIMTGIACEPATVGVVAGIVGAFTYGIGGAVVGTGGVLAQQQACPKGEAGTPLPTPPPPPTPPPAPAGGFPAWAAPAAVGVAALLLVGLVIYGAAQ
jgi:hypothetical protein